ncbi:sugar ABC transporter substrate-binding protein [Rhodococcus sp. 06-462-5]|jgi:multiple sugar transport system substrate-binding protein|nr:MULTISPECIES: extracellular solute-binding protein [unclassified Rhodococcus (in: high G+C Gram-positive bacteria)]OZC79354.1 sugar ABC transporter substrate-binding protein [Rhodococcus sp. 06-462-5]OZD69235.1 sugar ABC transporter substrate-binding protein [Rhodococcus sp. 05-340-2]OZD75327.1 sugar ABC transporter substrate-binding protein [Rhodococcus sp. 05-340-1]OZE59911.1 sugar ABC transporter substrate-binding protein [Rhodococcus sp. 02-925g]OZF35117.1 sugar ABC transporter substrat
MNPHEWPRTWQPSRRDFLRSALVAAGAITAGGALSACSNSVDPNVTTLGSRLSDPNSKLGVEDFVAMYRQQTGRQLAVNTVDSTSFQENVNNYLQGTPDDVITWMGGYRVKYFAEKGLVEDLSPIWANHGGGFNESFRENSTGMDGKQYLIPFFYYPWAVFYRPSLWAERGYEPPATYDQWVALSKQMQADGLTPIGFGARDGWPPFGTFDYLNLRLNGVEFHRTLLAGDVSWTDNRVRSVFDTWRELLPFHQPQPLGRKIADAQMALLNKSVGSLVAGMFVAQSFPAGAERDDLDFFTFPELDSAVGTSTVEAPMDGFMMRTDPRNRPGAEDFLTYMTGPDPAVAYAKQDPQAIPAHRDADLSSFPALVRKSADLVQNAEEITQFFDRDTRPDFASIVMIPALQQFIGNPNDVDGLVRSIERQKSAVFGT